PGDSATRRRAATSALARAAATRAREDAPRRPRRRCPASSKPASGASHPAVTPASNVSRCSRSPASACQSGARRRRRPRLPRLRRGEDVPRTAGSRRLDPNAEMRLTGGMLLLILIAILLTAPSARGDETCMSPYMPKITGQEDHVYGWTLGVEGVGDGSDKLVTVGANHKAPNHGKFVETAWMPDKAEYGYDVRVQPRLNCMLTSSFTGRKNYMRNFTALVADPEAMKHFGNSMVVWDFHARKPIQTLDVPGAPLEIRWALQPRHNYAFTTTALTSKIWLIAQQDDGGFRAAPVADIADPKRTPLPVDISLSADDRFLFVDTFMDGTCRVYDVSDPRRPRLTHEQKIGAQVNMVSETWDGERVYFTSSLL